MGDFIPTYSTDNIWRDENMDQCLSDDLDTIEANIAALQTGKANTTHAHSEYALATHGHSEYAATTHTHDGYAAENHTHTGYAASTHEHDNYALATDMTALQTLVGDTAVATQISTAMATKADVNHTHTGYATEAYVNTQVSGLVDAAPETLNTLNELAAALGDDPNFATTIATQIGGKANANHAHTEYAAVNHEHTGYASTSDVAALQALVGDTAVSTQISNAVATKVNQVEGKGLSANDYTDADKARLAGIRTYTSLNEAGITTFPTTMKIIAETMPNGSVVIIDTRRVNGVETSLSTQTISDWGNTTNGVAMIMKGDSEHRVSMQIVYSVTSATGAYMEYGNYAYTKDLVNWGSTEDKVAKTTLANIFGTYHDLTTTVTPGENYSAASGEATLVGNMLRVKFSATRTSAASGNISNETVANFSVAHGGKITGGFAVSIGNGTSGHLANMVVSSVACNETALTFKVTLTATGGDTSAVNPFFAMPVLIDVSKF